jgi:prepilin-type N-terminal cleavage/methylation domain-containing protein
VKRPAATNTPAVRPPPSRVPRRAAGGFTLVELLIVIAIIGLLATLAFVVLSRSLRDARTAVERQTIISLRNGVESFKQDFGFYPPLVDDTDPFDEATNNPRVRSEAFLNSTQLPNGPRHSAFSIPYYLFGMLPVAADGVDGPGFTEPLRDGTFSRRGREYPSRMDISSDGSRLKRHPRDTSQMMYVDRWGKAATTTAGWPAVNAIRYYRWKPAFDSTGQVEQFLTPRAVGDPNLDVSLRDAQYAIVSVGPDGVTDEQKPVPTAGKIDVRVSAAPIVFRVTADDIVEVGR